MELRHLRYFLAAAEEEHFSRAADRLCVTRPAVSQIVSSLEEELGTKLFERLPRGLRLTAAGAVYFEQVQRILADLARAAELTKKVGCGQISVLNIGYGSSTLHHPVFRESIRKLRGESPTIRLSLLEGSSIEQHLALLSGTLHLRFTHGLLPDADAPGVMQPDQVGNVHEDPQFGRLLIQLGRVAVALHQDHPLAARETLRMADLAQEGFVVAMPHSSVSPSHGRLASLCDEAGFEARVIQQVRNTATQLDLVSLGVGVGLVVTLPGISYGPNIAVRPLQEFGLATRFDLVWSRQQAADPAVCHCIALARELALSQRH